MEYTNWPGIDNRLRKSFFLKYPAYYDENVIMLIKMEKNVNRKFSIAFVGKRNKRTTGARQS